MRTDNTRLTVLLRLSSWLLLAAAASAVAVSAVVGFQGAMALAIGPWRLTAHDAYRPAALALACAGVYGLIGARRRHFRGRTAFSLSVLLVSGLVVLAIAIRDRPQGVAMGDAAIAELYVLHALKGTCLTGPYSQFGWNHPGPAMFYLLAPLYGAAARHPAALSLGALVINVAALAGAMYLAAGASAGRASIPVALGFGLWVCRAPGLLTSYWNPHLLVFSTYAFLWLAVSVGSGRLGQLPILLGVGSFLAQTHVGAVPVVVGVSLASILLVRLRARPAGHAAGEWRRAVNASAWTLVVLWALPLAEQLAAADGGNLTRLVRFFASEQAGVPHIAFYGLRAWAAASMGPLLPGFHLPVGWAVPHDTASAIVVVALLQWLALLVVARHRSSGGPLASAAVIVATAEGLALLSASRIPGLIADHAVFWFGAIGTTGWAVLLSAAASLTWPSFPRSALLRAPGAPRWAAAAVAVTALALAMPPMLSTVAESRQVGAAAEVVALTPMVGRELEAQRILKPLVRIHDDVWIPAAGVLVALYKQGRAFSVESRWRHVFGDATTPADCGHSHILTLAPPGASSVGAAIGRAGSLEARLALVSETECLAR